MSSLHFVVAPAPLPQRPHEAGKAGGEPPQAASAGPRSGARRFVQGDSPRRAGGGVSKGAAGSFRSCGRLGGSKGGMLWHPPFACGVSLLIPSRFLENKDYPWHPEAGSGRQPKGGANPDRDAQCHRHSNEVPSTQIQCSMTASFRATATCAFFIPFRLAKASISSFPWQAVGSRRQSIHES